MTPNLLRRAAVALWMATFLAVILPSLEAHADMGPKATMSFTFSFSTGQGLSIVSGELLQCKDPACQSAEPLRQAGPQHFTCSTADCESMAYGYSENNRLRITFSDGKTRLSNVFSKKYFAAHYQVMVHENDLVVQEQRGGANPFYIVGALVLVGGLLAMVLSAAFILVLVLLILREGQARASFQQSKWLYITAWVIALPVLAFGGYFSLALPITVAIEGVVYLIYAWLRQRPRLEGFTAVLLANLLTHPWLWWGIRGLNPADLWVVVIPAELLVWLVEAFVLYFLQRKSLRLAEALGLSLLLNCTSFGVGLLLRV